jgi:hypothetical protein
LSLLYLKGWESFIDHPGVSKLWFNYLTIWVKLHDRWGSKLETSVRKSSIRLPDCSSWPPGTDVA